MRTYIDLGNGVVSITATGSGSSATETTYVTPPLDDLVDLSSFTALDLELRLLSLSVTGSFMGDVVPFQFETSLQNDQDAPAYWSTLPDVEEAGDLLTMSAPAVMSLSLSRGVLRYLRWRISIPGHASGGAITVKFVFQLRGYGRSS
jgi:hypothetical protein